MTSWRQVLTAAAMLVSASLLLPAQASAHASLVGSDPDNGARLASAPRQIRLSFDESISRGFSSAELRGSRAGRLSGVAILSPSDSTLVVSLPKLPKDTYLLSWWTVSADDLHPTGGTLAFSVGSRVATTPRSASVTPSPPDRPATGEVIFRWADFGAIAGLIGALALLVLCVPLARQRGALGLEEIERRLFTMAVTAGIIALGTGLGLLVVQTESLSAGSGSNVGMVLSETSYGRVWLARELLIAALLVAVVMLEDRRLHRWRAAFVLAGAVALCFTLAANSHSASARGTLSVATAALALHVLAAALWAGGVCALAIALIGRSQSLRESGSTSLVLRSFGGVAVLSVAVLAITGLYTAGVDVASPDALVTTLYGRVLLVKTGLFVAVGLIGLGNSLLARTGGSRRHWLYAGIRVEATILLAILLPAALLTSSPPARGSGVDPARTTGRDTHDPIKSLSAGDLLVTLSVKPNQPGINFVSAEVFNTRRPNPAPIRSVDLAIARPSRSLAWRTGSRVQDDTWQLSGARLRHAGIWTIGLRIRRPSLPDQVVKASWAVPRLRSPEPASRAVLSTRPLAPTVTWVAGVGAALLALGGLTFSIRWFWGSISLRRSPKQSPRAS